MPTDEQARTLIESAHSAWSRGDLDGMLAQFSDDMEFWSNVGDPSGGPIEFKHKNDFRQSLEAVLHTTKSKSRLVSFRFDGEVAHVRASIRMESLVCGAKYVAAYRQIVRYQRLRISRIEEYHDAGLLNAFWKLHAEGAQAGLAVWDVEPSPDTVK